MEENLRIIISGGGTGGHIFPAVSIANAIKEAKAGKIEYRLDKTNIIHCRIPYKRITCCRIRP